MIKKLFEKLFNTTYTKLIVKPEYIELVYNPLFKKDNTSFKIKNDQLIAILKQVSIKHKFYDKMEWDKEVKVICNDFKIYFMKDE